MRPRNVQKCFHLYLMGRLSETAAHKLCRRRCVTFCTSVEGCRTYGKMQNVFSVGDNGSRRNINKNQWQEVNTEQPEISSVSVLYNVFNAIDPDLIKCTYQRIEENQNLYWLCTWNFSWPERISFTGIGTNKKAAKKNAADKCMNWLKSVQHIIKKHRSAKETQSTDIHIKPELMAEMKHLIDTYNNSIVSAMCSEDTKKIHDHLLMPHERWANEEVVVENTTSPTSESLEYDQMMKDKLENRTINSGLPIFACRADIINALEKNRIIIIKGGTGSGKSTQVPQYILDTFSEKNNASKCYIIVCQPRRISATSLAKRVAHERNEEVGTVVGYQVRSEDEAPSDNCGILYCTYGVLYRRLESNPTLQGYSHVILDEVHDRSILIDIVTLLVKKVLTVNEDIKLIVMSASLHTDLYQNYFDCPVIHVPGFLHPVKQYFLDDIRTINTLPKDLASSSEEPVVMHDYIAQFIEWIHFHKPSGAILCYLPGWYDITAVQRILQRKETNTNMLILPLHSRQSMENQRKIFSPAPSGTRKIILATDIAETGITIDDVSYVVDSAIRKQFEYDGFENSYTAKMAWVAKANIDQRKGRAGRVKPGESFHLMTRAQYEKLSEFPAAEVLRTSLDEAVLYSKAHTSESAENFFSLMIEPPSKATIAQSVGNLIELGFLERDERLTALGRRVVYLRLSPELGKAIVYSCILQCLTPVLNTINMLSLKSDLFDNGFTEKSLSRAKKKLYHECSDFIALSSIYETCYKKLNHDVIEASTLCESLDIRINHLMSIWGNRNIIFCDILASRLIDSGTAKSCVAHENTFADCADLVGGIILSSTNRLLILGDRGKTYRTIQNKVAVVSNDSVNCRRKHTLSPFLTCFHQLFCEEQNVYMVKYTSLVSPLIVFLFADNNIIHIKASKETTAKPDIACITIGSQENSKLCEMFCDIEELNVLQQVRDILWSLIDYFVHVQGIVKGESHNVEQINLYKQRFLTTILQMVKESYNNDIDSSCNTKQDEFEEKNLGSYDVKQNSAIERSE